MGIRHRLLEIAAELRGSATALTTSAASEADRDATDALARLKATTLAVKRAAPESAHERSPHERARLAALAEKAAASR